MKLFTKINDRLLSLIIVVGCCALVGCSAFSGAERVPEATKEIVASAEPTPTPTCPQYKKIRWFVGLGIGTEEKEQIPAQDELVAIFNALPERKNDCIRLLLEYVDNNHAAQVLTEHLENETAPDLIGPVGVAGRSSFTNHFLDLKTIDAYKNFDLKDFDPALIDFYNIQGQGQIGLPFAIFPSFIYVNADLFNKNGVLLPPKKYGDSYTDWNGETSPWNIDTLRKVAMRLTIDENQYNAYDHPDLFNPTEIVQFGYGNYGSGDIRGEFSLFGSGSFVDDQGKATIPDKWRAAAHWYHEAMWKDWFYPNGQYSDTPLLDNGNWFNSGKIAMVQSHLWYLCCFNELEAHWNIAVAPIAPDGNITAKVHADTFAILKGTRHQDEAFIVLSYLLSERGMEYLTSVYGGMPTRLSLMDNYFRKLKEEKYPSEDIDWNVVKLSLRYPDKPHHEEGFPGDKNPEIKVALEQFKQELTNNPDFDVDQGLETLKIELDKLLP